MAVLISPKSLGGKEIQRNTVDMLLRPWRPNDTASVLAAFRSPDMSAQFTEPVTDDAAADRWLRWANRLTNPQAGFAFAVVIGDAAVANVAVTRIDGHGCGWVSYWAAPTARGRGITTTALQAFTDWAHRRQGIVRLELGHRVNNPASCKVAVGAGYRAEGIERAKLRHGNERFDVERHAHLTGDPLPTASDVTIVSP